MPLDFEKFDREVSRTATRSIPWILGALIVNLALLAGAIVVVVLVLRALGVIA